MRTEELYPADYAKTNIDLIASKLGENSCVTVLAPSGFAKSYLLRYLAYNKKYRRRFRNLRLTDFIYIDIHEVMIEKANDTTQTWTSNPNYSPEINALMKVLYKAFVAKIAEFEKLPNPAFPEFNKENFSEILDRLLMLRTRHFYIIFDDMEELLPYNLALISSLLEFIRDRNKGRIDFIFTLENTKQLRALDPKIHGGFSNYISHKIVIAKLIDVAESFTFDSNGIVKYFDENVRRRTSSFKDKIKRLNYLSGGYLPYVKHLRSLDNLNEQIPLNSELSLASKRLLTSLTDEQVNILYSIARNLKVLNSTDLAFLLETRIVRSVAGRLSVFSPIMDAYLKIR